MGYGYFWTVDLAVASQVSESRLIGGVSRVEADINRGRWTKDDASAVQLRLVDVGPSGADSRGAYP